MGGFSLMDSAPAVSVLSRVRATALGAVRLPYYEMNTEYDYEVTSSRVALYSSQNPALHVPVASQDLEYEGIATTTAMGIPSAVLLGVADEKSKSVGSERDIYPVNASVQLKHAICESPARRPTAAYQDLIATEGLASECVTLCEVCGVPCDGVICENCGGSVLVWAPEEESQAVKVGKVPSTRGMAKRVLKGIPGLRGWHKCRGESQLESDEDRYLKRASMITQLACLRIWHSPVVLDHQRVKSTLC